jgi:hypothetical protein
MNLDDAIAAMRYLSAMTTGWADETTAAYAVELAHLENPAALMAGVRKVAAAWTDSWRPSLGIVRDAYEHELALTVARQREELARRGVMRCGGTGWVNWTDGEELPCPTCAPFLHKVWTTPTLMVRWKAGEEPWRLMDCADKDSYRTDYARTPCAPGYLDEVRTVSKAQAMAAAWKGYAADCEEAGVEADRARFDRLMGRFAGHLVAAEPT